MRPRVYFVCAIVWFVIGVARLLFPSSETHLLSSEAQGTIAVAAALVCVWRAYATKQAEQEKECR